MKWTLSAFLILLTFTSNSSAQSCNHTITVNNSAIKSISIQVNTPTPFNNHLRSYSHVDWGDGTSSYLNGVVWGGTAATSHQYANLGTYNTVFTSFTIDSNANIVCTDTIKRTVTITTPPCYSEIQHQRNPSNIAQVTFQAITPAGSSNKGYLWDLGGGNWSSVPNPTYTFSGTGFHRLYLTTINNPKTCSDTRYYGVWIVDTNDFCWKYGKNIQTNIRKNYVDFYLNMTGTSPHFTGLYNTGVIVKNHWDFGDGNSEVSIGTDLYKNMKATHKYANTGTYNVSLISEWKTSASSPAFCRDTLYDTIQIAQVYTTKTVGGYIVGDSLTRPFDPSYKVWLIKYDNATNILSAVDSQIVHMTTNRYYTYFFDSLSPNAIYRTKAAVLNGPTGAKTQVPTYSESEILWNNADSTSAQNNKHFNYHYLDIHMRSGISTSGPGFISGNVFQGANKGTSGGIHNMNVFLTDNNGKVVQHVVTNALGDYSFDNIPTGNYYVYPEHLGYITTPSTISITNMDLNITGVGFERSHSNRTITPLPVSISSIHTGKDIFKVYPNPTRGIVHVDLNTNSSTAIVITDVTGKTILTKNAEKRNAKIDLSSLQKGLYFITIKSGENLKTQKLILQ